MKTFEKNSLLHFNLSVNPINRDLVLLIMMGGAFAAMILSLAVMIFSQG